MMRLGLMQLTHSIGLEYFKRRGLIRNTGTIQRLNWPLNDMQPREKNPKLLLKYGVKNFRALCQPRKPQKS